MPEGLDQLRRIFPGGVCDSSKPSAERPHPLSGTWLWFRPVK